MQGAVRSCVHPHMLILCTPNICNFIMSLMVHGDFSKASFPGLLWLLWESQATNRHSLKGMMVSDLQSQLLQLLPYHTCMAVHVILRSGIKFQSHFTCQCKGTPGPWSQACINKLKARCPQSDKTLDGRHMWFLLIPGHRDPRIGLWLLILGFP